MNARLAGLLREAVDHLAILSEGEVDDPSVNITGWNDCHRIVAEARALLATIDETKDETPLKAYTVHMRTRSGMYAQYDGPVKVLAKDDDDAIERAFRELKRGAFADYSREMWGVEWVERVEGRDV